MLRARLVQTSLILAGTVCLVGCSIFGVDSDPAGIEKPRLAAISDYLSQDRDEPAMYHFGEGNTKLAAMRRCGKPSKSSALAQIRQLFVGFSDVQMSQTKQLEIGGVPVQRADVSATLDGVKVSAISYAFSNSNCSYDLVLWCAATATNDQDQNQQSLRDTLASAQKKLEGALPELLPTILR
jgi:hypothetical protein